MNIYTLSRSQVENIESWYPKEIGEGSLLVSIGNPGQTTGDIDEDLFEDVIRLKFHDADPDVSHGQVKGMTLLTSDQIQDVVDLIESRNPETLFVQCQAGQSRSCGFAYSLHKHYNDGDLKSGWENYNRFVERKVSETLRGYKKDEDYYNDIFTNED
jgi:predicted protein tyrosine phosphatase